MAFCFKLPHSHSVKFPNECFVCGRVAEKEYKIVRRQIVDFGYHFLYFTLKHSRMNVKAPVCTDHYRQLTILNSLFWLLILEDLNGIGRKFKVSKILVEVKMAKNLFNLYLSLVL